MLETKNKKTPLWALGCEAQPKGKDVYLQGSRQMDSLTRQYYERNLGAGMFVSPETENGLVGYSEPLRRFIQHEGFTPQVNEIANTMPSWIPGEDHLINFQKGDPYTKVDEGYARLPGAGYAALHPELEGVDPEDYPDITKLSILGDVAPYSREYNRIRAIVEKQSHGDTELRSRYEQIVEQVRQTKDSTLQVDERRFDAPVDQLASVKIVYTWSLPPAHIKNSSRPPGRPSPAPFHPRRRTMVHARASRPISTLLPPGHRPNRLPTRPSIPSPSRRVQGFVPLPDDTRILPHPAPRPTPTRQPCITPSRPPDFRLPGAKTLPGSRSI
jgi:hypothetical protein